MKEAGRKTQERGCFSIQLHHNFFFLSTAAFFGALTFFTSASSSEDDRPPIVASSSDPASFSFPFPLAFGLSFWTAGAFFKVGLARGFGGLILSASGATPFFWASVERSSN